VPALAADIALDKVLPAPACGEGWGMDGKVAIYDRDNLFERVNGESELYFPYGFELLASARYVNSKNPKASLDADVYRMGSLLDAFGIYASYRKREDPGAGIGAEGTLSGSQLFFYQGRYLVRLQATGDPLPGDDAFLACGRAIARKLPPAAGRPKELEIFSIPVVVPKSERYIAASLLGYDFFRRGVMADALLGGEQVQLFLIPEDSRDGARTAFTRYRDYLKAAGKGLQATESADRASLQAVDPLYGRVLVEQSGRFLIGVVRYTDDAAVRQLMAHLISRLGAGW
jgi:hypothetical protein